MNRQEIDIKIYQEHIRLLESEIDRLASLVHAYENGRVMRLMRTIQEFRPAK
jgi:hypothetical protein